MNLVLRSVTIQSFLWVQVLSLILWIAASAFFLVSHGFEIFTSPQGLNLALNWFQGLLIMLVALGLNLMLRKTYRKASSPPLFFLTLALFFIHWEFISVLNAVFQYFQVTFFWSVLVTRLVWAFRLSTLFALVSASLPSVGYQYQKLGSMALLGTVLGLALGTALPLDTRALNTVFLYPLSNAGTFNFVLYVLAPVVVVCHMLGVKIHSSKHYWLMALGSFIFLVGWFGMESGILFTPVLMIPGILIIIRGSEKIYVSM